MHLLTCEQISKSYSLIKILDGVQLSIDSSDKIGLIGVNGTGKSTLLKIIAGYETPDAGTIIPIKNLKIAYLAQEQDFDGNLTILEQIFSSPSENMRIIKDYERASHALDENPEDTTLLSTFNSLSTEMTARQLYDLEYQIKGILYALGITHYDDKISTLSGGQKKRVALAEALVNPCDLLILDEPTNHLDSRSIIWLERFLKSRQGALLMITHDRYFLDRIVNKTVELHRGKLYEYTGNYEYYLEKKNERLQSESSTQQKRANLFKKELAWMRAGVQARSTKSKSRIQRFMDLKALMNNDTEQEMVIEAGYTRLGGKIIDVTGLGMQYGDRPLFSDFEYHFAPNDRIGIVGDNGVGKSTLMNLLCGRLTPTSGTISVGTTVKFGYFSQEFEGFTDENQRAIEYIREIAEMVVTPSGYRISASEFMETFLFSADLQWTPISKLSGGERRRLQLMGILISSPNVLLLDEPTNNLDLDTLKVFESYLDQFQGVILCVSHDRYFLDRITDKLFAYEGGKIVQSILSYSDYLEQLPDISLAEASRVRDNSISLTSNAKSALNSAPPTGPERLRVKKEKLSFKELKLLETLPEEIDALSEQLSKIEDEIKRHATDFVKLTDLTSKKEQLEMSLLEKMEQLELLQEKEQLLGSVSE